MKVQVIGYANQRSNFKNFVFSPYDVPASLDEFDINVIDLSSPNIWINCHDTTQSVSVGKDFISIQKMVNRKHQSKILYILPQNNTFRSSYGKRNERCLRLKDILNDLTNFILPKILPQGSEPFQLIYENTTTEVDEKIFKASFYFDINEEAVTSSNSSGKTTTVHLDCQVKDVYLTTLDVSDTEESLQVFLDYLFNEDEFGDKPDWLDNIIFGDDVEQHKIIEENEALIEEAKDKIEIASKVLSNNDRYKSILYKSGKGLVTIIFEILEQILDCDLSEFVDEKKEDFNIKKSQCTFIGEIKGVTSNVKFQFISQVETNRQFYNDYLDEKGLCETTKSLLIINTFRTKKPSERGPVPDEQIKLAEHYGCLIIETVTLLWVFNNFKKGKISSSQCIAVFSSTSGLLKTEDFKLESA